MPRLWPEVAPVMRSPTDGQRHPMVLLEIAQIGVGDEIGAVRPMELCPLEVLNNTNQLVRLFGETLAGLIKRTGFHAASAVRSPASTAGIPGAGGTAGGAPNATPPSPSALGAGRARALAGLCHAAFDRRPDRQRLDHLSTQNPIPIRDRVVTLAVGMRYGYVIPHTGDRLRCRSPITISTAPLTS
jgi:hypothetical protein